MKPQPANFIWREVELIDEDGVARTAMAMVPERRYHNVCARQFADGGEYTLAPVEQRSMASHSHFFAAMKGYFDNLPEKIAERWPTPDHFRKWLLVECGWFDEKEFDMASEKHAKALGTFIRTEDEYARIVVRGTKVVVRRAKSQALAAMGKDDFQKSKQDVLELAEQFVGVTPSKMIKETRRIAG